MWRDDHTLPPLAFLYAILLLMSHEAKDVVIPHYAILVVDCGE